ncbi:aspartyl/asparaginyl beta-hydroxylase domain-containing protein [Paraburkholderia acidisoli]|uniref:Aspartyl beta-hydroxylase n=1 Tax=Paraburkholderia acidisoli TaxID=2571748 RepID=A0A7Z2JFN1_9BURK|nr:aspartyl/asparaginyl beta-hydroxylase domain-containing protein [Paraburkholderia acidisoli]QGZ62108.1 aspartyl beta-hydroxylase [Paraburkholderia acidisoli]
MDNFLLIAINTDVMPLRTALQRNPDLWGANSVRQDFANSPHADVRDILLRFSDTSASNIGDQLVCSSMPALAQLPEARPLIHGLLARVNATMLGRVLITRLPAGKSIKPHRDVLGAYAHHYQRYHIPLQSLPGCSFCAGGEHVFMKPGEVWWFNASVDHEVVNNSADDRIHLIIDARSD